MELFHIETDYRLCLDAAFFHFDVENEFVMGMYQKCTQREKTAC